MVTLPFTAFPSVMSEVTLDGAPYRFLFAYNYRGGYWTMTVLDRDLAELVAGIRVVMDYELLGQYPGRGLPPGELWAIDPAGVLKEIGADDLGTVVDLVYLEEPDLVAV